MRDETTALEEPTVDESTGNQATEATEASDSGPSAEEVEQSLKSFLDLAHSVANLYDTATGDLPEDEVAKVRAAYAALPVIQAKTKARQELDAAMRNALGKELNAAKAKAYMTLGTAIKAAGARESIAKPQVDPTTAFVDKVCAIYLAPNLVKVPEDVADDWAARVQEKGEALKGEVNAYQQYLRARDEWEANDKEGEEPAEPEVSDVVKQAARIARGRAAGGRRASGGAATGGGYTGPRRNVKAHIRQVFEDKPVGTFLKVAEICKAYSSEYGDQRPSQGAVTAALKSKKFDVPGIVPDTENGVAGARKVA